MERGSMKISLGMFISIIIIVILLIVIVFMYYYYDFINKEHNKLEIQYSDYVANILASGQIESQTLKIDKSKNWIHDANYTYDVPENSYDTSWDRYNVEDIIVPYININSEDAKKANEEIKKVFDKAIFTYKEGLEDKITHVDECDYKSSINENILSVCLVFGKGFTDVVHPEYYTYNFNLNTGKLLTYEEVYKVAGFNSSNILNKVQNAVTLEMNERMQDFEYPSNYPVGTNFDTYNNESINNYKNSITENSIKYFLDSNKNLNIIVPLSIPAGRGLFDTIITIK